MNLSSDPPESEGIYTPSLIRVKLRTSLVAASPQVPEKQHFMVSGLFGRAAKWPSQRGTFLDVHDAQGCPALERSHAHARHHDTRRQVSHRTPPPNRPAVPRPSIGPSLLSGPSSNAFARPPTSDSRSIRSKRPIFRDLLAMGLDLLRAFLALSGDGDVGPTLTVPGEVPDDPPRVLPRLDQPRPRPYLSIFGEIDIERTCYGHDRVEAAPLDAQLHLPQRQYSYLLQQWLGAFVVDDAHAEAIRKLGTILGLEIAVKASEDLNREQASDVEPYQNHLPVPEPTEEGPILVVTADCKGVPLVRKALPPEEATDDPASGLGEPAPRQGREGEQEEDGGGGCGLHDRAVRAHRRRGDRRSHEEEGRQASPQARAQAGACRVAGGQGGVVPLAGRRGRAPQPEGDQAVDLPLGRGTSACTTGRASTCRKTRSVSWICST